MPDVRDEGAVDDALARLRDQGERITSARRAVIEVLAGAGPGEGLGAEDIVGAVRSRRPGLHLSTVYRTLDTLEAAGLVLHTHLGHGRAVYRLAEEAAVHAECDTCGTRIAVPPQLLDPVARFLADEHDVELDHHHSPLLGRCGACREAAGGAPHHHGRR